MRYDQTHKQEVCCTIDIAFHPKTFQYLDQFREKFQNMICKIALESATKQLGEREERVSKDFKILQKIKCKGEKPALLPIRIQPLSYEEQQQLEKRQGGEGKMTKQMEEVQRMKDEFQKEKNKNQIEQMKEKGVVQNEALTESEEEVEEPEKEGIVQPKYTLTYQYPVDLQNYFNDQPGQDKPTKINLSIKLSKVKAMKEINQLDINDKQLILEAKDKYYLNIQLPFKVNQNSGQAKFIKDKQILKITLPIIYQGENNVNEIMMKNKGNVDNLEESEIQNILKEKNRLQKQEQQQSKNEQKKEDKENKFDVQKQQQENKENINQTDTELDSKQETEQINQDQKVDNQDINNNNQEQSQQQEIIYKVEQQDKAYEKKEDFLIQEIKPIPKQLFFKYQQSSVNIFLNFNLPGYDQNKIQYMYFKNTVIIINELDFIKIQILQDLHVHFKAVTGYLMVILDKKDQEEIKQDDILKIQEITYEESLEDLKLMKQEENIEKENEQKLLKIEQEKKQKEFEIQQQQGKQQDKETDQIQQEYKKEEILQQKPKIDKKDISVKNLIISKNPQFIDFKSIHCFNEESLD